MSNIEFIRRRKAEIYQSMEDNDTIDTLTEEELKNIIWGIGFGEMSNDLTKKQRLSLKKSKMAMFDLEFNDENE